MTRVEMTVVRVQGLYVHVESTEGHSVAFGNVKWWEPRKGDRVLVELDSDEYPVRAWHPVTDGDFGGVLRVWP